MAQTPFNPTPGVSTHEDCVNTINLNVTDAESRLGSLESAPPAHTHTVADLDSALAADGTVATADGAGNVTWEAPDEADVFSVVTVTAAAYTQTTQHTNHLYDDTLLTTPPDDGSGGGGGACMIVDLLPVAQHIGVTIHKKIGNSCEIELVAPVGSTIDGAASYLLTSQYEAISIFTDGTNYFVQ